jgi:hypothetical protein
MALRNCSSTLGNATQVLRLVVSNLYTIWLFTLSDLKTIVFPQSTFGILTAISIYGNDISAPSLSQTLSRIPFVLFWVWINLLPFAINNQRHPLAIAEDRENKPWRAMPSNRWTAKQAQAAMIFFYLVAIVSSWSLGSIRPSLALIFLG